MLETVWIEHSQEQHLFETWTFIYSIYLKKIFYNIINVFTSMTNFIYTYWIKLVFVFILLAPMFWMVVYQFPHKCKVAKPDFNINNNTKYFLSSKSAY